MTDEDIINAIRRHPDPFVSLSDIEGDVPRSKELLRQRLHDLAEKGIVRKKKLGARALAWWVPSDEPEKVIVND